MATKNIVPRADSEGQLGTTSKFWSAGYIDNFNIGNSAAANLIFTPEAGDTITFAAGANGSLTITTVDTAAAAANIGFVVDGAFDVDAAGAVTIDGSAITIGGDADVAVDIDASTLDIDSSAATSIDSGGAINITTTGIASDISIVSAHVAGVAFHLDADNNAGSIVDIDAGILDIDVTGATTLVSGTTVDIDGTVITLDASTSIELEGPTNVTGLTTLGGNLTFDSVALTGIQTSAETFVDNDVSLMTSAAIDDLIDAAVATSDTFEELDDTVIDTIAAGNILVWNGATSMWNNSMLVASTGLTLSLAATGTNTLVTDANQGHVTTVGALNAGSITSGFGNIDNGASTLDSGASTLASLVCTAAGTFGGGYGATGATISTAGVGQFNGALTTDGALTADNIVCTNAATFGGGTGSTGATISTAGIGTFDGAVTSTNYRTVYVDAGSMVPQVTNGAAAGTDESADAYDVMNDYFAFDTSTTEYVQFKAVLPEQWDGGTIKAKFYWKPASSTTTSHDVVWDISATAHADGGTIGTAWSTAIAIQDTVLGTAAGRVHVSPPTAAVTVAGSPAVGADEMIYFRVSRASGSAAADDLNEDAHLLGVNIQYKETTSIDAIW